MNIYRSGWHRVVGRERAGCAGGPGFGCQSHLISDIELIVGSSLGYQTSLGPSSPLMGKCKIRGRSIMRTKLSLNFWYWTLIDSLQTINVFFFFFLKSNMVFIISICLLLKKWRSMNRSLTFFKLFPRDFSRTTQSILQFCLVIPLVFMI